MTPRDDLRQEILIADLELDDVHHLIELLDHGESLHKVRRLFLQCLEPIVLEDLLPHTPLIDFDDPAHPSS